MKKLLYMIFVLAFAFVSNAFSQKATMELTFTAEYYDQYVPLDSIYVENLTQGGDTMLYAQDTLLVIVYVGVTTNPASNESFRVLQNCPNPFAEQTTISIFLPEADHLQVSVINLLGQKVAFFENILDAGKHLFVFYPGDDKYYILTATANGLTKAIKMVSLNNHLTKEVSLIYEGPDETQMGNKSTQETNDFGFSMGDQLRFTGFAKKSSDITGTDVIEATPAGNENYVFEIIEGIPCSGIPTVTYEGQTYNTVQIGTQCWFKENLNVGTMIDGSNNQSNNGQIEKHCYADSPANCSIYGGLYQWDEMMQYNPHPGMQGICPNGWHIPTVNEWTELTNFLGGEYVAGGKMKSTGTIEEGTGLWYAPNSGATNERGFTAYSCGYEDYLQGYSALFWTSTENYGGLVWIRKLSSFYPNVFPDSYYYTYSTLSCRCIKGESLFLIPTVNTSGITNINLTTAISGGNVTSDGGTEVTDRGVCWSASQIPIIAHNHTSDGDGTGTFVSNLTGLIPNTLYYIRAYATNNVGTAYGNLLSFMTISPNFTCGNLINYEEQNYNTILIGNQCWLKENLNVGTMINGSSNQTNNSLLEKFCFINDQANCSTYGGLYQWNEMMQYGILPGTQGICPTGWHIPNYYEWAELINFLGGESVAGGKMKATGILEFGTGLWWAPNEGATNSSGFTALPGGFLDGYGHNFTNQGRNGKFWSSTSGSSEAWYWVLGYSYTEIISDHNSKAYGLSVRCVHD